MILPIYYEVSKEYTSFQYTLRNIRIWISNSKPENGKISLFTPTIVLQFQKGTGENPEGKDKVTQEIIERQKITYYHESVEDVESPPNSGVFGTIARLFIRMENQLRILQELTMKNENDRFELRLWLLKKIGAIETQRETYPTSVIA